VFFIHAKNNSLLETVPALLEKIRNFLGNELGAVVNDESTVEILRIVDAIFDLITSRSTSPAQAG